MRSHQDSNERPAEPGTVFRTERLIVKRAEAREADRLQDVFMRCGDYFVSLTGRAEPEPDAAAREISASAEANGRNIAILVHPDHGDVGALGWWEAQPDEDAVLLGLLTIVPERRGRGLAREVVDGLGRALDGRGFFRLHAAAAARDERSARILGELGFRPLDERRHVDVPQGRLMIALYERRTAPGDEPAVSDASR